MEAERVVNVINKFKNRRKLVCKWKKRIGFLARPIFTLRERTRVRERERKRARSKGRAKGLSTISEILSRGEEGSENLEPEYIFKCIFHATNFGAPSPPLVEICNSFEPPSCPVTRDGRSRTGEHYHLYEILCASLCIVIIQPLFPGCRRKLTSPIQYKLPCGRRWQS